MELGENLKKMLGVSEDTPAPTKFANTPLEKDGKPNAPPTYEWRSPALLQLTGAVADAAGDFVNEGLVSLGASTDVAAGAATVTNLVADPLNFIPTTKGIAAAGIVGEAVKMGVPDSVVNIAKALERAGKSAEEIWEKLKIYRGPVDNKWRAHLPDTNAAIKPEAMGQYRNGVGVQALGEKRLDEVLDHPELFKTFPFLKWTSVGHYPIPNQAMYFSGADRILVGPHTTKEELVATILHEAQHKVQHKHNLTRGTNPYEFVGGEEAFNTQLKSIQDMHHTTYKELRQKFPTFSPNKKKQPKAIEDDSLYYEYQVLEETMKAMNRQMDEAFTKYRNVGGEAEARMAEKMYMNNRLPTISEPGGWSKVEADLRNESTFPMDYYDVDDVSKLTHPPTGVKVNVNEGSVHQLALEAQKAAGWDSSWPFIPADLLNKDFVELLKRDPGLSDKEKEAIFKAARNLGVM